MEGGVGLTDEGLGVPQCFSCQKSPLCPSYHIKLCLFSLLDIRNKILNIFSISIYLDCVLFLMA
jgi:hypothetical protein